MKRILCAVLALVMLCATFAVPVYAEGETGVVPTARVWSETDKYFVELRNADLDAHDYERGNDGSYTASMTCKKDDDWLI